jgi:hypothetical protein
MFPAPVLRSVHGCAALDALEHSKARKSKSDEKLFIFFVPRVPHRNPFGFLRPATPARRPQNMQMQI